MNTKALPLLLLHAFGIIAVSTSHARFRMPELQEVPLERILQNLSKNVEANPEDAEALHKLARTHAMAFSKKLKDDSMVNSWKGWDKKAAESPWYGHQPAYVPFKDVAETDDAEAAAVAKAHLETAIATYKKALALKPDDTHIKLGLAWCQLQAGQNEEAVAGLKAVADDAWEKESKEHGSFGPILYVETAGYLIPLLDEEKDAELIADMEVKKKKLQSRPRAVTPLVVPVGESTELNAMIDRDARVRFDLDGTGRQLEWQWITPNAAWLVYDPAQSGKITSAIQMFGSSTFLLFCNDGYEALAVLDDNRDGRLTGKELEGLSLWRDKNSDGTSDPGEVLPVSEYGISSLSTSSKSHASGILFSPNGATYSDGSIRPTYDLVLESK